MEREKIQRINDLARLSRERGLTPEETAERDALRREYIDAWRESVRQTLESVRVKQPDGSLTPLRKKDG